jgi:hypothetical protein
MRRRNGSRIEGRWLFLRQNSSQAENAKLKKLVDERELEIELLLQNW